VTLSELTDRNAMLRAAEEYDRLRADEFLARCGYQFACSYYLAAGGRLDDSEAIRLRAVCVAGMGWRDAV
jgi:hypothetical protein